MYGERFDSEVLALAMHHDSITGTSALHVIDDLFSKIDAEEYRV